MKRKYLGTKRKITLSILKRKKPKISKSKFCIIFERGAMEKLYQNEAEQLKPHIRIKVKIGNLISEER